MKLVGKVGKCSFVVWFRVTTTIGRGQIIEASQIPIRSADGWAGQAECYNKKALPHSEETLQTTYPIWGWNQVSTDFEVSLHTWFLQPAAKVEKQSRMKIQSHCCGAWGMCSCPSSKENFLFDFTSVKSYWVLVPSHCYLTLKLLPEKLSNSEYLETSTFKNFHLHSVEKKGTFKMIIFSLLPFKFRITERLK